jgi:hypothetical protein
MRTSSFPIVVATLVFTLLPGLAGAAAADARAIEEVRNTVINLLESMVQKGIISREQAEAMVKDAQSKAAANVTATAESNSGLASAPPVAEPLEQGAISVPYIPAPVREKLAEEMAPDVTRRILMRAKTEGWGVPGALPEWLQGVQLYGDVRFRAEADIYDKSNVLFTYLDYNVVNLRGGIGKAGNDALLNVSVNRERLVGRARLGAAVDLGGNFRLDLRLASGTLLNPISTNQTFGNYDARWAIGVDRAAVLWNPINQDHDRELDLRLGRFANPFVSTSEMIWDTDISPEGFTATYALDLFHRHPGRMDRSLFLTLGAMPLQEVELSTKDKWLLAAQLGAQLPMGPKSRLRFTAAYYDFRNVSGVKNSAESTLQDFTAPRFLQKGNTLFDIRNTTDTSSNLFALAGEYRLMNANLLLDVAAVGENHVQLGFEYVKNVGWNASKVQALTGLAIPPRVTGYDTTLVVGRPALNGRGQWRASFDYRSVQRDAVLDAFTDSDFHLGGTDARGYQAAFDVGLSRGVWLRLRYLTADAIDNAPLGIDVWQFDVNGQF